MRRINHILMTTIALLALGAAHGAEAQEIRIAGSTTVASAVLAPYEQAIEKKARTGIVVNAIGSSRGIEALARGDADLAAISAPLADIVRKFNSKNPGSVDGRELVAHEVGAAKVAFVVHPSNPIKELTFEQITDILAGRIRSWDEVGGAKAPIEVITEYRGGGIRAMVEKTIGEWGDVLTEVSPVQTGPQVIFAVSQVPNALGVAASSMVDGQVFLLRTDETITQPLFLVSKGEPTGAMAKVIEAVRGIATGAKTGS